MEGKAQKDLLARIADAGEDALSRLASSGSADRVLGMFGSMKEQVDALSLKVRGIDQLEKRVEELEKKVEELSKASSPAPARKTSSSRKTSSASSRKTSSES